MPGSRRSASTRAPAPTQASSCVDRDFTSCMLVGLLLHPAICHRRGLLQHSLQPLLQYYPPKYGSRPLTVKQRNWTARSVVTFFVRPYLSSVLPIESCQFARYLSYHLDWPTLTDAYIFLMLMLWQAAPMQAIRTQMLHCHKLMLRHKVLIIEAPCGLQMTALLLRNEAMRLEYTKGIGRVDSKPLQLPKQVRLICCCCR